MKPTTTLVLAFFAIAGCWAFVIFNSAISSLPFNPLTKSKVESMRYSVILPQGWAFFTRSPREDQYYAYKMTDGVLNPILYTNSSYKNAFGFSRGVRVRGVEMGGLMEQLKDKSWIECPDGILGECIAKSDSIKTIPVNNKAQHPTFCGEVWLERKPIVPWAWSKAETPVNMPSEFIKIQISCN